MHFVVFIPGASGVTDSHLARVGLSDLCRDNGAEWCEIAPDSSALSYDGISCGTVGMMATWRRGNPVSDPPFEFPRNWQWRPNPPSGDIARATYWIGWDPQLPPGPADLERPNVRRGMKVDLADRRSWIIPSAYYLPHHNGIDLETGKFQRKVDREFESYSRRAGEYALQVFQRSEEIETLAKMFGTNQAESATPVEIPLEESFTHSCEALAINYRLNPMLITLFELLDDAAMIRICCASFDLPLIVESGKKTAPVSPIGLDAGQLI